MKDNTGTCPDCGGALVFKPRKGRTFHFAKCACSTWSKVARAEWETFGKVERLPKQKPHGRPSLGVKLVREHGA